ncbi:type I-E CRISPR-associated protein Cas5/CasD [Corynebacterium pygosceleis]|uniref:Type I-E CRISPR-associated protein Cas5/CasD n=1 Tax=Corynebacterium pygosceleis TaxID=2800406 RepID=A0ABT3WU68_9CORY|nr:type I-E CRISPR-associated protein Cas5/CasD [Corynebacterium pygosceleis]MCK7676292.1 type I-E CRISPR-associated protein Cas5/CasD [Corynebacterium pygosceleis]MCL0121549.1 type I-E CRISPR-associated protein Cas5/CasD [Corynebacterium pygosceleis]MCX7445701.1 type I-E CRISPR-associated protein Cas5/CasD [Corynebacterium pygosceleis]
MTVAVLQLAGPLQAWGSESRFKHRRTLDHPTKSGVIGLVAAALGRSRDEPVDDLASLRFGTRIDQPGRIITDFQTEIDWRMVDKGTALNKASKPLTHRDYLSDAVFLAALEGPDDQITEISEALRAPVYPLFLGRRSCPPGKRVFLGIEENPLDRVLREHRWIASKTHISSLSEPVRLHYNRDALPGEKFDELIRDTPRSFSDHARAHDMRGVVHGFTEPFSVNDNAQTTHDPMLLLRGEG